MRAFVLNRYGGPDAMELRHVPRPSPGAGEVLLQVHAAGLNPVDFKTRQGQLRMIHRHALPIVAGSELSGVVVAHTLLVIVYHVLTTGEVYRELGADYFDQRNQDALARRLVKRLSTLGYTVALEPVAA